MDALKSLAPHSKARHCVRHLHANLKSKGYKGQHFKDELQATARATTRSKFDYHMRMIKSFSEDTFKYLDEVDPKGWSRHAFRRDIKCDILLNNIAESFNSWIKDAREQPILSMLELIMRQIMNRFVTKRVEITKVE